MLYIIHYTCCYYTVYNNKAFLIKVLCVMLNIIKKYTLCMMLLYSINYTWCNMWCFYTVYIIHDVICDVILQYLICIMSVIYFIIIQFILCILYVINDVIKEYILSIMYVIYYVIIQYITTRYSTLCECFPYLKPEYVTC